VEEYSRVRQTKNDNIIWHMRIVFLLTKATDTHSEYVILVDFPLQQWLLKCASVLCYMYIACLVSNTINVLSPIKL
jgi:hypothetical protein